MMESSERGRSKWIRSCISASFVDFLASSAADASPLSLDLVGVLGLTALRLKAPLPPSKCSIGEADEADEVGAVVTAVVVVVAGGGGGRPNC